MLKDRKRTQFGHPDLLLKSRLFTELKPSETESHYVILWPLNLGTQRIALFCGVALLRMARTFLGLDDII